MGRFTQKTGAAVLAALCMAGAQSASAQTCVPGVWIPVTNITAQSGGGAMELNWGDFRDLAGVQIYASPSLEPGRVDWQPLDAAATQIEPVAGTDNVYPLSTVSAAIEQDSDKYFYRLRAVKEWQRVTWEKVAHTLRINLATGEATKLPADYAVQFDPQCRGTNLYLRAIMPGKFPMGSPDTEVGYHGETLHEVTLTNAFYIGVFEVTQKQWELLAAPGAGNPLYKSGGCPRDYVSWNAVRGSGDWPGDTAIDGGSFMGLLRGRVSGYALNSDEVKAIVFDLPTEAQWEYACRAGTETALNNGKDLTSETGNNPTLDEVAWYDSHLPGASRYGAVGMLAGNAAGLYDMHGNMWEWCRDWLGSYTSFPSATEPVGPDSGPGRVVRGGDWYYRAQNCRSAYRAYYPSDYVNNIVGFRVGGTLPAE